jgi:hypothetical protein
MPTNTNLCRNISRNLTNVSRDVYVIVGDRDDCSHSPPHCDSPMSPYSPSSLYQLRPKGELSRSPRWRPGAGEINWSSHRETGAQNARQAVRANSAISHLNSLNGSLSPRSQPMSRLSAVYPIPSGRQSITSTRLTGGESHRSVKKGGHAAEAIYVL